MRMFIASLMLLAFTFAAQRAAAAPQTHLNPQLDDLLKKLADALETDIDAKGRTFSLGPITSKRSPDSNFAPELRRLVETRLRNNAALKGRFVVSGGLLTVLFFYDLDESKDDVAVGAVNGKKMQVLKLRARLEDQQDRALFNQPIETEINDPTDIAVALGLTVGPPPQGNQDKTNDAIAKAARQNQGKQPEPVTPTFQVREETRVGIPGDSKFFVEILVKDTPDAPARPIKLGRQHAGQRLRRHQGQSVLRNRGPQLRSARMRPRGFGSTATDRSSNRFNAIVFGTIAARRGRRRKKGRIQWRRGEF